VKGKGPRLLSREQRDLAEGQLRAAAGVEAALALAVRLAPERENKASPESCATGAGKAPRAMRRWLATPSPAPTRPYFRGTVQT
jgi:hypothetical protein